VIRTIVLDKIDSTNSYAKSLKDFDGKLTVIRAYRQTAGRGRSGNAFFSDSPGGLWVSIIAPITDISTHFTHNRAISIAIFEALINPHREDPPITIKWPNDIYWGDRKVAGILLENIPGRTDALIIGFGVNVNMAVDTFPEHLRDKATSVWIETGRDRSTDDMLDDIVGRYRYYADDDPAAAHRTYCNSLYKKGCRAAVGQHTGTFVTVEIDGRLRLDTNHGTELLASGTLRFLDDGGE